MYLGADRIGYILDACGFVKKVEYKVKFMSLNSKFVVEMDNFETNDWNTILITDQDGSVKDVSGSAFYDVPDVRSCHDVDSLFEVDAV